MSRHVVFGAGQVGAQVITQLVAAGHEVIAVSRSGHPQLDGATSLAGDATDPRFTTRAARGADVVYFCLNAPDYARWADEFPPLQRGVLAGAAEAGARLVVLDNLYAYGPTNGAALVETMAARPTSTKAETRAAMTDELLVAHEAGRVEIAIGRASDYFGPGTPRSALGETVFATALAGRTAQVMGDPHLPHTYSFTPDVAAGLITLATSSGATGQVWHLPVGETRTTREVVDHVYELAGRRPKVFAAGRTTLRLFGIVKPAMREYLHTLYQFDEPWVVDDTKFRTAFGDLATPVDEALAATLEWYRDQARATAGDHVRPAPTT